MEDGQDQQEFPSLVAEIFLTNLKNVKLLKTCRLVCKSWNIYACEALRNSTFTSIDDNSWKLKGIASTLSQRSIDPLALLPSPFKNYHVRCTRFSSDVIETLASTSIINMKRFEITLKYEDLDEEKLRQFFNEKKQEITALNVRSSNKKPIPEMTLLRQSDVRLPCCQNVSIDDNCSESCECVSLTNSLLVGSRLINLELDIKWPSNFATLLEANNLLQLKKMILWFSKPTIEVWKALLSITLPELKTLKIHCRVEAVEPNDVHQFNLFLRKLSPTLTILSSSIAGDFPAIIFPNLAKIYLTSSMNNLLIAQFTPNYFPCLREISIKVPIDELENWIVECQPHNGVQTLHCRIIERTQLDYEFRLGHEPLDKDFFPLLTRLSRQFPKVSDFKMSIDSCTASNLMDIHRFFPTLRDLQINGPCDFLSLNGTDCCDWIDEDIPRRIPISKFHDLESLTFGKAVSVTRDTFKHGLVNLRRLKYLSFPWNRSLVMDEDENENLFKGLDHVQEIRIHCAGNWDHTELLFRDDPRVRVSY